MQSPVQALNKSLTYHDRVDVAETFADSLEKVIFDGSSIRMEFIVNRLDEPQPPKPPTGKRVTAARLVMTPQGFIGLVIQLNQLMQGLQQQGIVKTAPVSGGTSTIN